MSVSVSISQTMTSKLPPEDPLAITDQDLLPANLVLPDYVTQLRLISSGGMGAVFEAKHKITGQRLAVKVLLPKLLDDETSRKRFVQEANTIKALSSAHIVTSFDYGTPELKAPYMVMEFIEGTTLAARIKEKGPLDLETALEVFIQVATGLSHAHASGIIHRDIKPSNIMLGTANGDDVAVKIVDFGMAKFYRDQAALKEALTISGNIVGTPLFMSPEQCLAKPLDVRSDIYSLGCVMYLAATGELPINGATVVEMFSKHVSTLVDVSILDEPLKSVISRCLEKNPDDRYQSVEELKADLVRIQQVGKARFHLTGSQKTSLKKTVLSVIWVLGGFAVGYMVMVFSLQWLATTGSP
ncbi:MAG: serine/threonine-protein kinase [Candidatus Melainabacteria bacterium]|nr:serine/threonine-protein kinase [Candidatus Melainabacteria bacterium]